MRARDILRDFYNQAAAETHAKGVREGIVSDVFGTLIKRGQLNERYYNFLLWAIDNGIPVTMASSEQGRAIDAMKELGCDERLVSTTKDKISLYGKFDDRPFEVIIDDSLVLQEAEIVIHPDSRQFTDFLAKAQYKALSPTP